MAEFSPVYATVITVGNVLQVGDVDVRLKSNDAFSLAGTPPDGNYSGVPDPPQPFTMAKSTQDPRDKKYQISKLVFDRTALGTTTQPPNNWHRLAFDPHCILSQKINIADGTQKNLEIRLSCNEDPQTITNHLAFALQHVGNAFVALGNTIIVAAEKLFGRRAPVKAVLPGSRDIEARHDLPSSTSHPG